MLCSCNRGSYFVLDYNNSNGKNPQVYHLEKSKDLKYSVEYPQAKVTDSETVTIYVEDLEIGKSKDNYSVSSYTISECYTENGKCGKKDWRIQAEFDKDDSSIRTDINTVLVLDVSSSLDNNIGLVKSSAKQFARSILNGSPSSSVGLVMFSKNIEKVDFVKKDGYNSLSKSIDNYAEYDDRTSLYEASMEGLRMLERSTHKGAKNLIIFTDGGDNNSDNPIQLRNRLLGSGINRYAIGLEGEDFDEKALKELATKEANYVIAKNTDDLKSAFETIAQQVKTIYSLEYRRSDQTLDRPIYILYEFETEKQRR